MFSKVPEGSMVGPTCPKGATGFLMGQGKGNLGGKFSPWGHRLDLEAKAKET
jgi:hypothetical protein